jgi:hypothetical protein
MSDPLSATIMNLLVFLPPRNTILLANLRRNPSWRPDFTLGLLAIAANSPPRAWNVSLKPLFDI